MATAKRNVAKRKRPETIKVMATPSEKKELKRAADKADVPLAVLVRTLALAAIRRGETVIAAQAAWAAMTVQEG